MKIIAVPGSEHEVATHTAVTWEFVSLGSSRKASEKNEVWWRAMPPPPRGLGWVADSFSASEFCASLVEHQIKR